MVSAEQPTPPPEAGAGRVHLQISQHVAVLTLDRPAKLNALTSQLTTALAEHVAAVSAQRRISIPATTSWRHSAPPRGPAGSAASSAAPASR